MGQQTQHAPKHARPGASTGIASAARALSPRTASDWAILAIAVLAMLLRVWHIGYGLPEFTEEAIPFRKALEMWRPDGSVDWNPHLFHYPSLTFYLQLFIQRAHYFAGHLAARFAVPADYLIAVQIDPTSMVILGRLVGVISDVIAVICVGRIAERLRPGAGPLAALLVAFAPTQLLTGRSIFTDTVMTAFAITAIERMLAWREHGGRARLAASAILIGLATGAKYPGAVLLLPLAWVMWERERMRGLMSWAACALAAFAVFLATTPYALLDFSAFMRDFEFVGRMGSEGTFGNLDRPGFAFHLKNLVGDVGWVGIALLAFSLVVTAVRPARRGAWIALWLAFLAFGVPIAIAHVLAERYLVSILPIAAVLIATAALELANQIPSRTRTALTIAALVVVAVQPVIAGVRAASSGARSTQAEALRWCERNLTHDMLVVQEMYGAPLLTRLDSFSIQSRPMFAAASPAARARFHARPWFSSVTLPLAVVGSPEVTLRSNAGASMKIAVVPHGADLNQACYDPRLFAGVDYFVATDPVRGRFEADPRRYAVECRFYALLDSTADVAARFTPRPGDLGRAITVYRIGPRTRAAIKSCGALDPLWWAEIVPGPVRAAADSFLAGPASRGSSVYDANGEPAAWVRAFAEVYTVRYRPFAQAMALELIEHKRYEPALRFASSMLAVEPADVQACLLAVTAARETGDWTTARRALERSRKALEHSGEPSGYLELEYAVALAHDGEIAAARANLERLTAFRDSYVAGEARRRLDDPAGPYARAR